MAITVEAVYENGVLKPTRPLPLREHATVTLTIASPSNAAPRTAAVVPWNGAVEVLDYLIADAENDPLEGP